MLQLIVVLDKIVLFNIVQENYRVIVTLYFYPNYFLIIVGYFLLVVFVLGVPISGASC